jgi:hypothetical protein
LVPEIVFRPGNAQGNCEHDRTGGDQFLHPKDYISDI